MSHECRSYEDASAYLGKKLDRPFANNTRVRRVDASACALKLHATDVVTWYEDGRTVLDSGGWLTVTTKDRMNWGLPRGWRVWSDKGVWYVSQGWPFSTPKPKTYAYADGLTIAADDSVTGEGEDPAKTRKLRQQVQKYAAAFVEQLKAGKLGAPGPGDCWDCVMREVETGVPLGELHRNADHILSHLKERYYVPSLLERVRELNGLSKVAGDVILCHWIMAQEGHAQHDEARKVLESGWYAGVAYPQIRKALKRYMYQQLGLDSSR
jgi:hypothetical protein